jgi:hypothetical protein
MVTPTYSEEGIYLNEGTGIKTGVGSRKEHLLIEQSWPWDVNGGKLS